VTGADQQPAGATGPRADVPADGVAEGDGTAAGPRLTVNGDDRTVAAGTTVAALVAELGLEPRGIAVAVDGEVVRRRSWDDHVLAGGEQVEVLTIAQGG
jgi:sulfur carrier protein